MEKRGYGKIVPDTVFDAVFATPILAPLASADGMNL